MREIKFKAWDKKKKEIGVLTSNALKELLLNDCFNALQEDYELMQFTGLKDRNGKEIYEGDIMSVLDRDWPSGDYTNQTPKEYMKKISSVCEVVYEPTEFYLKQIKGRGYFYPQMTGITHRDIFEVIGNIYENPELIN